MGSHSGSQLLDISVIGEVFSYDNLKAKMTYVDISDVEYPKFEGAL